MIPNLTIGGLVIDCANTERARDFYADLMGWEKTAAYGLCALKTENGLTILFAETDAYEPPVWPEEPGRQQKQMHLDLMADDLQSAVERAVRLGATKTAEQYGDYYVTLLDTEGHPFCICGRSNEKSDFDLYYEKKGYGAIPNSSINIDCKKSEVLRGFYARLTEWDQGFHYSALLPENRMVVHFMGCDGDFDYIPPVWPEAPGAQQKHMYFIFLADDLSSAVDEAVRIGAVKIKTAERLCGGDSIALLDTEGHPFCLRARKHE